MHFTLLFRQFAMYLLHKNPVKLNKTQKAYFFRNLKLLLRHTNSVQATSIA